MSARSQEAEVVMAASSEPDALLREPFVEKKINRTVLRLEHGDLTALPVDAFGYVRSGGFGTVL